MKACTAACSPSITASTVPSTRFRTQPDNPCWCATSRVWARKYTPCTRPEIRILARTGALPLSIALLIGDIPCGRHTLGHEDADLEEQEEGNGEENLAED